MICPHCGRRLYKCDVEVVSTYLMFTDPTVLEKKEAFCRYCGTKLGEKKFVDVNDLNIGVRENKALEVEVNGERKVLPPKEAMFLLRAGKAKLVRVISERRSSRGENFDEGVRE